MRIAPAMLAIFASVLIVSVAVFASPSSVEGAKSKPKPQCTDWRSKKEPPPDIAVYRVKEKRVERVDFKLYVARVVSHEWNVKKTSLRKAGAVAVKQYAWYHVLHWRGGKFGGECYDVKDTTADQIYRSRPVDEIPARVQKAVNSTWSWYLTRKDKFPMTGYRRGPKAGCGHKKGNKLYARSAKKCAKRGWTATRLLSRYYSATVHKK